MIKKESEYNICHKNCGACCQAPSISSPLPQMPQGKPAGKRCIHLTTENLCKIYEKRPPVCRNFQFDPLLCGKNSEEALKNIEILEELTRPL